MTRRQTSLLRIGALLILLAAIAIVLLLPGSTGCPPRTPGELDPLECEPSALTPPRLIVLAVGIALAATLWVVAFIRETDER